MYLKHMKKRGWKCSRRYCSTARGHFCTLCRDGWESDVWDGLRFLFMLSLCYN